VARWLVGCAILSWLQVFAFYDHSFLIKVRHFEETDAGEIASLWGFAGAAGAVVLPLLSDRTGRPCVHRRRALFASLEFDWQPSNVIRHPLADPVTLVSVQFRAIPSARSSVAARLKARAELGSRMKISIIGGGNVGAAYATYLGIGEAPDDAELHDDGKTLLIPLNKEGRD
jgi:hypothetical protein